MPQTAILVFREAEGGESLMDWLKLIRQKDPILYGRSLARILELADYGHEMRRPHTDYLDNGIYELRFKKGRVQHRILYFYHGQHCAVLTHAITKKSRVPPAEIERAVKFMKLVISNPTKHTLLFEVPE